MRQLINLVIITCLPHLLISQTKEQLNCIVKEYVTINSDSSVTPIDTVVSQIRLINIYKPDSIIDIGFQLYDEKKDLIYLRYYLISENRTKSYNLSIKDSIEYTQYLLTTDDYYPLILLVNLDYTFAYLYYYWSNEENRYLKSEKLEIISREMK